MSYLQQCINLHNGTTLILHISFSVANLFVWLKNMDIRDSCNIWIWYGLIYASVLNFCAFLLGVRRTYKIYKYGIESISIDDSKYDCLFIFASVWAPVIIATIEKECALFYVDKFPLVWLMIYANYGYLVINAIAGIGMLGCYIGFSE